MSILKTENCPICNTPTGALKKSSVRYNKLFVCQDCTKKLAASGISLLKISKYGIEELREIVGISARNAEEHASQIASFKATKAVGNFIQFDDRNRKFAIPKTNLIGKIKDLAIYDYSDILDYELIEDGNSISKGGVGRAIVGGALFGGIGAIVGGSTGHKQKSTCSKLQVKITMNNMSYPTIYINFIEVETKKDGLLYKQLYSSAQETMSLLDIVVQKKSDNAPSAITQGNSVADEIVKFKELLDGGVITQTEFDAKKKQLLGL